MFYRIQALECLLYMSQCSDEADMTDIVLRDSVKKVFVNMMPGIVSAAQHACCNILEHHRVVQVKLFRITIIIIYINYNILWNPC